MKILKRILFFLLGIVALLLIVALFVKKDFSVTREVVVNKPLADVFNYVKYVKNQDNFSVWNQIDPAMQKTYTGTDGTPGFIYAWNSQNKNAGQGAQEIKKIEDNKRVDFEIRFEKPMKATNYAYMTTTPVDSTKTQVQWTFYGTQSYPMNLMNLFLDGMVGKDLQGGLDNLKKVLER